MNHKKTWMLGALALAAAGPAYGAPSGAIPLPPSSQPPQSTPPTTQPAPPPATPPATPPAPTSQPAPTSPSAQPAPTSPSAQPASANANAQQALDFVHTWAVRSSAFGQLAKDKGTSQKVKDFGQELMRDNGKLDQQANQMAAERGIKLTDANTLLQDPSQKQGLDQLRSLNGAEFDRSLMQAFLGDRERMVDQLKQLRDQTPGKDAKLKKWLDDAENVMEQHRNDARIALKDVTSAQQRQGRTPGK